MDEYHLKRLTYFLKEFSEALNAYHEESRLEYDVEFKLLNQFNSLNFEIFNFIKAAHFNCHQNIDDTIVAHFPNFRKTVMALKTIVLKVNESYAFSLFQQLLEKLYQKIKVLFTKVNTTASNYILKNLKETVDDLKFKPPNDEDRELKTGNQRYFYNKPY